MGGSCGVAKKNLGGVNSPMTKNEVTYCIGKYMFPPERSVQSLKRLSEWEEMLPGGTDDKAVITRFIQAHDLLTLEAHVWEGVPVEYRWVSWLAIKGLLKADESGYLNLPLGSLDSVVYKDINRTFPQHPYFRLSSGKAQASLSRILSKYEAKHTQVGYCQGMNFIAGFILIVSGSSEVEAFYMFESILDGNLSQMYSEGMPYLKRVCYAFNHIFSAALPDLSDHLLQEGVPQELWVSKWFLTLFTLNLPMSVVVRVWDLMIVEGEVALHKTAIGIMEHLRPRLLTMDLSGIVTVFNSLSESCPPADILIELAWKHKITPAYLNQLMQNNELIYENATATLDIVLKPSDSGLLERLESMTSVVSCL